MILASIVGMKLSIVAITFQCDTLDIGAKDSPSLLCVCDAIDFANKEIVSFSKSVYTSSTVYE